MRRFAAVLVCCAGLWVCGCQPSIHKREITALAIVTAIGLDPAEEGLRMTILVRVSSHGGGSTQGSNLEFGRTYSAEGATLTEAIVDISSACESTLFFGHTQFILIAESLWHEDIATKLDMFARSSSIRQDCLVNAVFNSSVEDFLTESVSSKVDLMQAMRNLYENESVFILPVESRVSDIMLSRTDPTRSCRIPLLSLTRSTDGTAIPAFESYLILCSNGVCGVIGEEIISGMHLLRNEVRVLRVNCTDQFGAPAVLELISAHSTFSFSKQAPLRVTARVEVVSSLLEYWGTGVPSQPDYKQALLQSQQASLLRYMVETVGFMHEHGCDLLDLSEALRFCNPRLWESLQADWHQVMRETEFTFEIHSELHSSYQINPPLGYGEVLP